MAAILDPFGRAAELASTDVALTALVETWFQLLLDNQQGSAPQSPQSPQAPGGESGAASGGSSSSTSSRQLASASPSLLDLLASVELCDGALGPFSRSPLHEAACLASASLPGSIDFEQPLLCAECRSSPPSETSRARISAGQSGSSSVLVCRHEWSNLFRACLEIWGPRLLARKALRAASPSGTSLFSRLLLGDGNGVPSPALLAGAVLLLRATGCLTQGRSRLRHFLQVTLPDSDSVINCKNLELLLDGMNRPALARAPQQPPPEQPVPQQSLAEHPPPQHPPPPCPRPQAVPGSTFKGSVPPPPSCPPPPPPGRAAPTTTAAATTPTTTPTTEAAGLTEARELPLPEPSSLAEELREEKEQEKETTETQKPAELVDDPDDPLPFLIVPDVCGKIGLDAPHGLLVRPTSEIISRCCICLEDFDREALRHCSRPACGSSAYCLSCLRQHAETVVLSGLYAAPCVRCPSCNLRLGTSTWSSLVSEQVMSKYKENAKALLTYRCGACDETGSYFEGGSQGRDPFSVLDISVRERLLTGWQRFFLAEIGAEDFVQLVLEEYSCGLRTGGAPPAKLGKVFGPSGGAVWISDIERRLAVQLAWMHRFPMQRTPCCGERFCFRCKVSNWHHGITCQERLQSEKARHAQACPGCGVPTIRSEGCRKITCVCGRVWEWETDDSSDDDSFEGSDDEDGEVPEAQTAMNLVAMNTRASEENVATMIQALVNARADVNLSESTTPLVVSIQARNAAAVAALCEHGARVTPEVLEEVKLVAQSQKRKQIEETLRPHVQGDPNMKLPLWVWVQAGSVPAVEALLRNASHEEVIGEDVFTALRRSRADEETRRRIDALLRENVGEAEFNRLRSAAATRTLLAELRQALDEDRDLDVQIIKTALEDGADVEAREDMGELNIPGVIGNYRLTALNMISMNSKATGESISSAIHALLDARADVNAETDEAGTPLLAALQHRNVSAVEALCKAPAKFTADILDELKTMSDVARRHRVEDMLYPIVNDTSSRRLPLWYWIQQGSCRAVDAMLAAKEPEEEIDLDCHVALQRCRGSPASRQRLEQVLRQHSREDDFERLRSAAATRRLLQELREAYDDERAVCLDLVRDTVELGADANAQEEVANEYEEVGSYSLTALQLLTTNIYVEKEDMSSAVAALVAADCDVNLDVGESALLSAVQHRCIPGITALVTHGAKVTADVLEEFRTISGPGARAQIEDILWPLIDEDKSLRCPLWVWVQIGGVTAVEALLRNSSHSEVVDNETVVAVQRCRAPAEVRKELADRLKEYAGDEEYQRLEAAAATRRLLQELREALSEEREPDLGEVCDALAHGANPNAREDEILGESEGLEDEEEESETEDEEEEEEDEEEDDEEDEDATVEDDGMEEATTSGGGESSSRSNSRQSGPPPAMEGTFTDEGEINQEEYKKCFGSESIASPNSREEEDEEPEGEERLNEEDAAR